VQLTEDILLCFGAALSYIIIFLNKMKELHSTFVKTVISLAVVFSFYPPDNLRELWSPYNPVDQLQEWFLQTIKPNIERHITQDPETFMTTVTL
jgi:hypothetical protein